MRVKALICILCFFLPVFADAATPPEDVIYLEARPVIDGESRGEPLVGTRLMSPASMVFQEEGKDWTVRFVVIHADEEHARVVVDIDRGEAHVGVTVLEVAMGQPTEVSFESGGHRIAMEIVARREME